jgi:hypothetical protein
MKITEQSDGVVMRLRKYSAAGREERLEHRLRRWIEDPLRPRTHTGNLRLNPILVLLAVMVLLGLGTFLFFSLVDS